MIGSNEYVANAGASSVSVWIILGLSLHILTPLYLLLYRIIIDLRSVWLFKYVSTISYFITFGEGNRFKLRRVFKFVGVICSFFTRKASKTKELVVFLHNFHKKYSYASFDTF